MAAGTGMFEKILGWIPNWVGFGLIILAGLLAISFGVTSRSPGLVAFGVAAIASAILAWVQGTRSKPDVNPTKRSLGATLGRLEDSTWLIIFGLFVVALLIALFVH